jgi:molybdopterin molybdotransferase
MLPLTEARRLIRQHATVGDPVRLPLAQARGRLLREDICAREDFPAFDRSAMDGYALRAGDPSERLRVIAEIQPGSPADHITLSPGECARVFTGAAIPPGATAVLMQEDAQRDGEWMTPTRRDQETHIRYRGEDVRAGDTVLRAGLRLHPAELSILAHLGHAQPLVSAAPRVIHIATGRELIAPEQTPAAGEIRDSNSTLIAAELAAAGADLVHQSRCGDELDALVAAIAAHPRETWDLLLISGGASVGDYDFGQRALTALGFTTHFTKLDLRPGKPLIFASRGPQLAFVIPGNPVSHFVLFYVAIRAALEAIEAAPETWPEITVPLAEPIPGRPNPRTTFWPATISIASGQLLAKALRWQSSGDLTGLAGANALIHLPPNSPPPAQAAACLLLRELF